MTAHIIHIMGDRNYFTGLLAPLTNADRFSKLLEDLGAPPVVGSGRVDFQEVIARNRVRDWEEPQQKRRRTDSSSGGDPPPRARTPAVATAGTSDRSSSLATDAVRESVHDGCSDDDSRGGCEAGGDWDGYEPGADDLLNLDGITSTLPSQVEALNAAQRQEQQQKEKEKWLRRRKDDEDRWAKLDQPNLHATQSSRVRVMQGRKDANNMRVQGVKKDYASSLPHVRESCALCKEREWVLGDSTFAITLLFQDFARRVELPVMVCGKCNKSAPFNPVYIDMFMSSPITPVCRPFLSMLSSVCFHSEDFSS